jgi:hypothetical protein
MKKGKLSVDNFPFFVFVKKGGDINWHKNDKRNKEFCIQLEVVLNHSRFLP